MAVDRGRGLFGSGGWGGGGLGLLPTLSTLAGDDGGALLGAEDVGPHGAGEVDTDGGAGVGFVEVVGSREDGDETATVKEVIAVKEHLFRSEPSALARLYIW